MRRRPTAKRSTSSRSTDDVSPGVVITSAPWAIPSSSASSPADDRPAARRSARRRTRHRRRPGRGPPDPCTGFPRSCRRLATRRPRPSRCTDADRTTRRWSQRPRAAESSATRRRSSSAKSAASTPKSTSTSPSNSFVIRRVRIGTPRCLPQTRAIVEVVGDHGPVSASGRHRRLRDLERRLRQPGEDATGVEPAHTEFAEEMVPVHVVGLERRSRGVGSVVDTARACARRSPAR